MTEQETIQSISASKWIHQNAGLLGLTDPERSAYLTTRELIENSLDACESIRVVPTIVVTLTSLGDDKWSIKVKDNGSGIPDKSIVKAFGTVLSSSKYVVRQSRGFLGMGGKGVIQYAYIQTQTPFIVLSSTPWSPTYWTYKLGLDINENKAFVVDYKTAPNASNWHGTVIQMSTKADFKSAMKDIQKYLQLTYMLCPYINLTVIKDSETLVEYKALTTELPKPPEIIPYHPHGIDVPILEDLLKSDQESVTLTQFIRHNLQRVGSKTCEEFLKFAGLDGDQEIKKLIDDKKTLTLLVDKFGKFDEFLPPDTDGLSPIGRNIMTKGLAENYHPEWVGYTDRKGVFGGHGFVIEVCMAFGGLAESPKKEYDYQLYRAANKIPLLHSGGSCLLQKTLEAQDFKHYKLDPFSPLVIYTHLCSTKIPHKTIGKEFIADQPDIKRELDLTYKEAFRDLKHYLKTRIRAGAQRERISLYARYIPILSENISVMCGEDKVKLETKLKETLEVK